MDALLTYLLNHGRASERIFVSHPPGPALLVWSDFDGTHAIAGITLVRMDTGSSAVGMDYQVVLQILKDRISHIVPVLDILYSPDVSRFVVDGEPLSAVDAARRMSDILGIRLGRNAAKKPNSQEQISDPFHIWSREVFDGIGVRKVDIDALVVDKQHKNIKTILEIKRSSRIKVGSWNPYLSRDSANNDYWNYVIALTLCKMLGCDFITFHHEIIDGELTEDTQLDMFRFSARKLISNETIFDFGSDRNRRVIEARALNQ